MTTQDSRTNRANLLFPTLTYPVNMSDILFNLEMPDDIDITEQEDYMDLSDEQWQQRITDIMKDDEDENTPEQLANQDNELFTNEHATAPWTSDVPSTGLTTDEQQSTGDIDISYAIVKVRVRDSARI